MKRHLFFFSFFIILALILYNYFTGFFTLALPIDAPQVYKHKILLLPLDSRPPCKKFVIDIGKIANIEIITPPPEILDYYTQAGNTDALGYWLENNISNVDAAVISIDQLIHGGLIAAREAATEPQTENNALLLLEKIHAEHPDVPIYAFNILPRINPPASIDNYKDQKNLIKYSRLTDELATFDNPKDLKEIREIAKKLPPAFLQKYCAIYAQNTLLNEKLSEMAKSGIIKKLIIGQDDGEDFGIPNMEKKQIQRYLVNRNISDELVSITHGADEVALTLLYDINKTWKNTTTKIYVEYNDLTTPSLIMPYMATSVASTVNEKIRLMHAQSVDSPDKADFVLFVFIGTDKNLNTRHESAQRLQNLLTKKYKIALVDLSKHFSAEETLFPILINQDIPTNQFIAYAGWNTVSNSIGTALVQGAVFCTELPHRTTRNALLSLYKNNLTFLNNRYMEDYFYLKDVIEPINTSLKNAGYANVYDLDMDHNYKWANFMLQQALNERATRFKHTKAFRQYLPIILDGKESNLRIKDMYIDTSYPWPRTFEIYMQTQLFLEECPN